MNLVLPIDTPEAWKAAREMHLRCQPASDAARGLVDSLFADLSFPAGRQDRQSTAERRRIAIGAIFADLLRFHVEGVIGSHGMAGQHFAAKALGFGKSVFVDVRDALVAAGLLEFRKGGQTTHKSEGFGEGPYHHPVRGWMARFSLTPAALKRVESAGVALYDWKAHWARQRQAAPRGPFAATTADLVVVRGATGWGAGGKSKGETMPVDPASHEVRAIVQDLQAHNAFMAAAGVVGVDFVGLRRIFNGGDLPGFCWRWGGRFYSIRRPGMDRAYETLSGPERREAISIGGSAVGEADINASQFRLLYALQDVAIPADLAADPYALPGLDRDPVKLVVAQALGKASAASKGWGREAAASYAKANPGRSLAADYAFGAYRDAVVEAHPILRALGGAGVPPALELQYVESEVLRSAMAMLRASGTPALPVHDSLVVPVDRLEDAAQALARAFKAEVGKLIGGDHRHLPKVALKGR